MKILDVNPALCDLLGRERQALSGGDVLDLVHPEDRHEELRRFSCILEGQATGARRSVRLLRKGDGVVWADTSASLLAGEDGQPEGFLLVVGGEEPFRLLVNEVPVLIWVTDANGRNQFVNRFHHEFFGVSPQVMVSPGWRWPVHPDDEESYYSGFEKALRDRAPFSEEVRIRRHDGEWRWVESNSWPRLDASGQFIGVVGSDFDITERKMAEQGLRQALARVSVLSDIVSATVNLISARAVGETTLRAAARHLELKSGSVYLLEEREAQLRQLALYGYTSEVQREFEVIPVNESSYLGRMLLQGLPLVTHESEERPPTASVASSDWRPRTIAG